MDFNQWYKKSIENQPEDPPEGLWESIQNDLDINDVWARLETDIGTPKRTMLPLLLTIAASFLFIVFLGSLFYLNYNKHNQKETAALNIVTEPDTDEETAHEELFETDNLASLEPIMHTNNMAEFSSAARSVIPEVSGSLTVTSEEFLSNAYNLGMIDHTTPEPYLLASIKPGHITTERRAESLNNLIKDKLQGHFLLTTMENNGNKWFSDATIGLGGQLANTWLLNEKTFNGLQSTSLTNTNATLGQSFGFMASTNAGKRTWLRLEWYFHAQSGQSYHEYLYGQYTSTRLQLNYHNLALTWHMMPGIQTNPHRIIAGMYTGFLKDATLQLNKARHNVSDEYSRFDYGVMLGYEYIVQWKPSLNFNIGVFSKVGLSNIFTGNEYVPASLNQTQNAALILSFSVNYSLQ